MFKKKKKDKKIHVFNRILESCELKNDEIMNNYQTQYRYQNSTLQICCQKTEPSAKLQAILSHNLSINITMFHVGGSGFSNSTI